MAVYRGRDAVAKYRNKLLNIRKELQRQEKISERQGARAMIVEATKLAPIHTGETIRSIRLGKQTKHGQAVESWVPGPFKQNLWANQTAPFRSVPKWWNNYQPTVYGDGTHKTTGTPRFWHFATLATKAKFRNFVRRNTQKALRVT